MKFTLKWSALPLAIFLAAMPLDFSALDFFRSYGCEQAEAAPQGMKARYFLNIDGEKYYAFYDLATGYYIIFDSSNQMQGSCSVRDMQDLLLYEVTYEEWQGDVSRPEQNNSNPVESEPPEEDLAPTLDNNYAEEVLRLVNIERAKVGAPPLTLAADLTEDATVRAAEIFEKFSHDRPDGSDCFTAIRRKGSAHGENIAGGQDTPAKVMESWMDSEGHRTNILDPKFKELGVGYFYQERATYHHYWVQLFRG